MNIEDIEKFITSKLNAEDIYVKISFKKREPVYGLFVKDKDYTHLKSKNFWRIVTRTNFDAFQATKDMSLARIFNGSEFSRLALYKEPVE